MSGRAFGSPSQHVQRRSEFDQLHVHAAALGHKAFVLVDVIVLECLGGRFRRVIAGLDAGFEPFGSEWCREEIERVAALA